MAKQEFKDKVVILEGGLKKLAVQFERAQKDGKSLAEINKELSKSYNKLNNEYKDALKTFQSKLTAAYNKEDVDTIKALQKELTSLKSNYKSVQTELTNVIKANKEQQAIAMKSVPTQTQLIAKHNEEQRKSTATVKDQLNVVKQRLTEEGKLIEFQTKESKKLRNADRDLRLSQIKNSKKSLEERKKDSVNYLNGQLRQLTKYGLKDTEEYKKIQIRREKITKEYNDKIEAANRRLEGKSFKGGFFAQFTPEKIGATLGGLTKLLGGYRAYRAVVSAISNVTVESAKKAIEFQAALGNLGAVAGKSSEEIDVLGKKAIEVANATTFTAIEVVGLQTQLSRLGFSIQQISESTLSIAQAAQALGESIDVVAQKVGQVLKQFSIDAALTNKVTDTLVSTINNSALSFEGFGTAIQYVGPLAAELGTTFEETAGAMAVLADNGFTASRVGTGLRGIITSLGVEGQDLRAIIQELADEHLSFAEAVELVGKRNAAQLITLVDNIDRLQELDDQYEKSGSALSASAKQVSTFTGNVQLLNSAWDAFQIQLGSFVANSGLVRTALRLLSNESYQTSVALGVISGIDTDVLAKSIKESVDLYDEYREDRMSIEDAMRKASIEGARTLIADSDEAIALAQAKSGYEFAVRMNLNAQAIQSALKIQSDAQQDYNDLLEGTSKIFEEQIRQNKRLDISTESRTATEEKYQSVYDRFLKSRRDENLTYEKAVRLNSQIEAQEKDLRDLRNGALKDELDGLLNVEKAGKQLTEAEIQRKLELEAITTTLDIYIAKISTLVINEEELQTLRKKGRKEIDDAQAKELKRLREIIRNEKDALKRKAEQLEFEAKLAEKAGDSALAEEKRQQYIEAQRAVYEKLNKLVRENNILTNESKDALGRMFSTLAIDEKETLDAFNSLIKVYAKSLEGATDEQLLDAGYQKGIVDAFVENLQNIIPALKEATDEELEPIKNAVYGALFGTDTGDKALQVKKATQQQIRQLLSQLKDALRDSLSDFNDTAFDNLKSRLDAEKDAIKERYEFEERILQSKFDNQIISETQFRRKQELLRKEQIQSENAIAKKEFDAEKKRDANQAKIDYLEAIASIFINEIREGKGVLTATQMQILGSGIATLRLGAELSAIESRKFVPKKFEQGGLVEGPSHSNGGVPFTVQGRGGYEMEGGEFIVNKKATAMHYDLLKSINNRYAKGYTPTTMFANGGLVRPQEQSMEQINLLRDIAEATTGTAINTSKPTRAYITNSDLQNNETQRNINNRNTRL